VDEVHRNLAQAPVCITFFWCFVKKPLIVDTQFLYLIMSVKVKANDIGSLDKVNYFLINGF